jgi:hypothetical protein
MEDFEFDIEFNEAREKRAVKVQLKHFWKRNLTWGVISLCAGIILLVLNLTANTRDEGRVAFMIFAFIYGLYILYLYYRATKTAQKRLEIIMVQLKEKGVQKIYFNDQKFGSSHGFGDCEFTWNSFTTYEQLDHHLIVYHAGRGTTGIVIGIEEIGHEQFDRLCKAVKTKIAALQQEVV